MSRNLLVIALVLTAVSSTHAKYPFEVGLKGGLNVSNLIGRDVIPAVGGDPAIRLGSVGGFFVRWQPTKRFSIQADFLYTVKGEEHSKVVRFTNSADSSWVEEGTLKSSINYVEIPVLARFSKRISSEARSVLMVGPALSFLKSAQVNFDGPSRLTLDIGHSIRSVDFSAVIGAGLDIDFGFGLLHPQIRYTRSLRSIDGTDQGLRYQNSTLSFLLGYSFGISAYPE